jgi:hypothetical protein
MPEYTITIDSHPGFATDEILDRVCEVIEASKRLGIDPEVGTSDGGVVTVVFDVAAPNFNVAVPTAVAVLEEVFAEAGFEFPINHAMLPEPVSSERGPLRATLSRLTRRPRRG